MDSIGVRELRQHASRYLERVDAGETIQVTVRGRPVAVLAPVPVDRWEAMIAAGEVTMPELDWRDLPPPRPQPPGVSASARLEEMRAHER